MVFQNPNQGIKNTRYKKNSSMCEQYRGRPVETGGGWLQIFAQINLLEIEKVGNSRKFRTNWKSPKVYHCS